MNILSDRRMGEETDNNGMQLRVKIPGNAFSVVNIDSDRQTHLMVVLI